MTATAAGIGELLAVATPQFDARSALPRVRQQLPQRSAGAVWQARLLEWLHATVTRPLVGAAAAVALIASLFLTPAGSLAQHFITVFQPQQVAPLEVTTGELRTLPNLSRFGTVHAPRNASTQPVANADAAGKATGMTVLTPASLPSGVPSTVRYQVMQGQTGTFTFDEAKAQRAAARHGKTLPPMPAGMDGSTLQITTGAGLIGVYGPQGGIPTLAIGQMRAPTVRSTGVSVKVMEDYILGLPGVSPQLAASIRALGDPTSTLPLPIPVNVAHGQAVQVQGVQGVVVGDSTGLGSGVIWEKGGIVYGVGGTLTQSQVLDIANSLH